MKCKNEKVNRFLLVGDKLMPEMHLKQTGFIYSTLEPFIKTKKDTKIWSNRRFKITKNPKYDGYQRSLTSIVYYFFDERNSCANT